MLGDGSVQIFGDIYESVTASMVAQMFEVIHIYPTREFVEEEIRRIRRVLPKARESEQRVRKLKLVAEDVSKLGIQAVGFDASPVDGAEVFIFDSAEHPAEGWGMKSVLVEDKMGWYAEDAEKHTFIAGPFKTEKEAIDKVEELGGEEKGIVLGYRYISDYAARRSMESKANEDRYDAEQTMKPQEEDTEVLPPDEMEDYSKEDEEEKGSKSKGTHHELKELPDEKLDHEVKYESIEPLHLCNACFKTFRNIESRCTECESINVERLVEEDEIVLKDENIEQAVIAAYTGARKEGKSREEAVKIASHASMGRMDKVDIRNLLLKHGVDNEELPEKAEVKEEVTQFKVVKGEDVIHKKYEGKIGTFVKIEDDLVGLKFEGVEDALYFWPNEVEQVKGEKVDLPESKVAEEKGEVTHLKKVFSVTYTLDGKETETRIMAFDEPDARRELLKSKKDAEVINVKQIGEAKTNESVQELVRETPGISTPDMAILDWAIENNVFPNEFPEEEEMIDQLSRMEAMHTTKVDVEGMGLSDPEGLDLGEIPAVYLKYVLLPKALDAYMASKEEEPVGESKLKEQGSYEVVAKSISDEQDAKEIARDKDGQVVPDAEDDKKFQVIVKNESKEIEDLRAKRKKIEQQMLDSEKKYRAEQNELGSQVDDLNKQIKDK